jgi:Peptidase family M50.
MFGIVQPTPFDMEFTLGRIPVRISVWFWLAGTLLGFTALREGLQYLLAWLLVLLISILVHEMGHALTAQAFGYSPSVLLYHFGGLAYYQPDSRHTRLKSILISLAGPGAGFLLFGLTYLFARYVLPQFYWDMAEHSRRLLDDVVLQMLFINLYWGLVNLLPVLPLDGGRISQEVCSMISPRRGILYAAYIGVAVAALAAMWFLRNHQSYAVMLFAMLAFSNYSIIQQYKSGDRYW